MIENALQKVFPDKRVSRELKDELDDLVELLRSSILTRRLTLCASDVTDEIVPGRKTEVTRDDFLDYSASEKGCVVSHKAVGSAVGSVEIRSETTKNGVDRWDLCKVLLKSLQRGAPNKGLDCFIDVPRDRNAPPRIRCIVSPDGSKLGTYQGARDHLWKLFDTYCNGGEAEPSEEAAAKELWGFLEESGARMVEG